MEHFARWIVKRRKLILVLAVLLLIPSVFGALGTYINYDILTYLPKDLDSMIGETYLEDDFNMASVSMITVENMSTPDTLKLKSDLEGVEGVQKVMWTSDFIDVTTPKEMLPSDIQKFFYNDSGATMLIVQFDAPSADARTMNAQKQIKNILNKEMPLYILCAVGASLLILFLSLKETIVPLIFMLGMLFPIVYNFGTNIFLGQISYITEALATVLQLGVTMDFSIFLLHRYEEEKLTAASDEDAMVAAIKKTFSSITGSSLTTIAGFLAMCTMQLTLGEDIGVVMAKGVLLGVICTITVLPSLIMTFRRAIEKHTHRTFIPKLKRTSNFVVKHRVPILIAFIIIFIPFFIAQSKTSVYYTIFDALPQDLPGIAGTNRLKEDFDMTTSHFIIVDDTLSEKNLSDLSDELSGVDGIHQVLSYEKFVGGAIPEMFIPDAVRDTLEAGGHKMILANSSYKSGSDEQNNQLSEMIDIVKKYDPNGVITGEGAMTKDLIEVADVDFNNVNITSIIVVFVIIAIVFRSASVPVLLVAAIESAIMINLGIPYFTGTTLPFIASIVIGTIQLGATVDYAILMTTRFREERNAGHTAKEAAQIAVEQCSQSILTSGLTFFAATFSVSLVSRMELIGVLCKLISRGALISMAVILLVLPALLVITEPILRKTTFHWLKKPEITEKKA